MSYNISILLPEKKLAAAAYLAFLQDCSSILGSWRILEHSPFDLNAAEVHDCVLLDSEEKYAEQPKGLSVWVSLVRSEHIKKYGRSRRKIYWKIYTETKFGRGMYSLVVQMLIPLKAYAHFPGAVTVVEGEKVFLDVKNYEQYARGELVKLYGVEALAEIGLRPSALNAPNKGIKLTALQEVC